MANGKISRRTQVALKTLANMIKSARKMKEMTQEDLAERLNVNVKTVVKLESKPNNVASATLFEAADIVGIPLLSNDNLQLQRWQTAISDFNSILPSRIRNKEKGLGNDF